MTLQDALSLRVRIERGELIPLSEYTGILDLIQDLINTKEHLSRQQIALIKTQAFLTRCQQSRKGLIGQRNHCMRAICETATILSGMLDNPPPEPWRSQITELRNKLRDFWMYDENEA